VSQDKPILSIIPSLYVKIKKLLKSIINKKDNYASFDASLVAAATKGYKKFQEYYNNIKKNNIY
jgi:hypothetical protein